MVGTPPRILAAGLLALASACASARARPQPAALDAVVWPAPPAQARVRLDRIAPDPNAPRPRRAWWRVALEVITGAAQPEEERRALQRPFGVAFGPEGRLFVGDPDAARVVRVDSRGTVEDLECSGRSWGAPMAVALDTDGSLLVADAGAGVIVRWSATSCRVLGAGLLERPTGVAATADRIWVADPARHQVVALNRSGELLARVGQEGSGDGGFRYPSSVAIGRDGQVLVVDTLNFRVVRLDADGRWLGAFGYPGDADGAFVRPKSVAVDAEGRIFVSDAERDAVLAFAPDGAFLFAAGKTGGEPGRFAHPAGLAIANDRLAVADSHNRRIEVFEMLGGRP